MLNPGWVAATNTIPGMMPSGSLSNPVITPAPTLSPTGNAWGGLGPNLMTCSVTPVFTGDLMVFAFFSNDQGVTALSGGGVSNWQQATSFWYNTGGIFNYYTVSIWWGTVTTTGASTITVTDPTSQPGQYTKIWCREFTAASPNWAIIAASPPPGSSGGSDLGTGATIIYPTLTPTASGNDLYVGACYATSYVHGNTPGFFYETPQEPSEQVCYSTSVSGPVSPVGFQATAGPYVPVAALFTAGAGGSLSTAPAYATSSSILGGGTGTWVNPASAQGPPDGTAATWTAP